MLQKIKKNINNISYILIPAIIIFIVNILLLNNYKKTELEQFNNNQINELGKLENYINFYNTINLNKLKTAERIFFDLTQKNEIISTIKKDSIYIDIIDNGISRKIKIEKLLINNSDLYLNNKLTERIRYMTNTYISIWQKTKTGYIRVVSSKPGISNEEIPIFLKKTDQEIKEIESGKQYISRKYLNSDTELSIYNPIYIKGNIECILQTSLLEYYPATLGKIYNSKKTGFFILYGKDNTILGNSIIDNIQDQDFFLKTLTSLKKHYNKITFENNTAHTSYHPVKQLYVGFIHENKNILKDYYIFKKTLIYSSIILYTLFFTIFILLYFRNKKLNQSYYKEFINIFKKDYFTKENNNKVSFSKKSIIEELNSFYLKISTNLNKLTTENINLELTSDCENSEINKSFKKLHEILEKNATERKKQAIDHQLQEKINKGNSEIADLLQHVTNLETLSFNILKSITKFLGIQQAGLFISNESNNKQPILEMIAGYAYDKKRLANKTIQVNEGLIGRAYLEKESIYLTEVPDKYTLIESGFGEEEPKSLLIVPLIFNNKVEAIIELASISKIENYKIKFIEDAGESIASTISNLKHSKQAEELLSQTTIQSKEIEEQRKTLEEKINTHRKQNRKLDKEILQLIEIIESIKSVTYMIEYDLKGSVMDISRKTLDLFEGNKRDLISSHHYDFISTQDYKTEYKTFWDDLAANKSQTIEETFLFKGKEYKFKQTYVPIRNVRRKIFRILSIGTLQN